MKKFALFAALIVVAVSVMADDPPPRPDFPDIQLTDTRGQPQTLTTFRGAVTVLNFWATWCGPCRLELPELEKIYNELGGRGFVVLAVNVEGPQAPVSSFMQKMGLSLPVYFIEPEVERTLGISSVPFTVILDRQGRAVRAYPGYSPAAMADLRKLADELLAEGRS